jgi:RNA polymerase sigma-70 factor (ECF subfamily)
LIINILSEKLEKSATKKIRAVTFRIGCAIYNHKQPRLPVTTKAFNQAVEDYSDRLFRFALKLLKHEADAEDVVQMAFEALWRQQVDLQPEKIKSWLFTTTHHKCVDLLRKSRRLEFTETLPDSPVASSSNRFELRELLDKGLELLPSVQRAVLLLRDYEGYPYDEIGEMTGLTESQVKVYIFRARKRMQEFIISKQMAS